MPFTDPIRTFPRSPDLPSEIRDQFIDLVRTLEPFEAAGAASLRGGPVERRAFSEMMEWNGVLGPKFGRRIEKIGRAVVAEYYKRATTVNWRSDPAKGGTVARAFTSFIRAQKAIGAWMKKENRQLALFYGSEIEYFIGAVMNKSRIRKLGFEQALKANDAEQGDPESDAVMARIFDWFRVNEYVKPLSDAEPCHDIQPDEIFSLVRDMEFMYVPGGIPVRLPALTQDGVSLNGWLNAPDEDETETYALLFFVISDRNGLPMATGLVSRLTGEISLLGMNFVPVRICFNDHGTYEAIRASILQAILAAVDTGALKERTFVNLTPEEITQLRRTVTHTTDRPLARPVATKPGMQAPNEAMATPAMPSPSAGISPPQPPQPPTELTRTEIAAAIEEMNRPRPDSERRTRIIERRSCMTWRQVMNALVRIGVEIDLTTTHPKLRFNGRKAGYVGSHEANEGKIRKALYVALDDLGIEKSTFFANLR